MKPELKKSEEKYWLVLEEAYLSTGEILKCREVIEAAGGGSMTTVGKIIKLFRDTHETTDSNKISVPESIEKYSLNLSKQLWNEITKQNEKIIENAEYEKSKAIESARLETEETYIQNDKLVSEIKVKNKEISILNKQLRELKKEKAALDKELKAVIAENSKLKTENTMNKKGSNTNIFSNTETLFNQKE